MRRRLVWTGLITTHVQGMCRMGGDPERLGVVHADGQSWDVKRLYVGDGSVVRSRMLSVNPSLG